MADLVYLQTNMTALFGMSVVYAEVEASLV